MLDNDPVLSIFLEFFKVEQENDIFEHFCCY